MANPQQKPQPDIYTVLLAISLVAMIICIVLMYMETADYGDNKTGGVPPVVQKETTNAFNASEAVCYTTFSNIPMRGQAYLSNLDSLRTNTNETHGCSIDFAFGKRI